MATLTYSPFQPGFIPCSRIRSCAANRFSRLRPILQCIQEYIEPLRKDLKWGYDIPYMITGQVNRHPRPAMAFNEGDGPKDIVAFYDAIMDEK